LPVLKNVILTVSGQYNGSRIMDTHYSVEDLLDFLTHASERGLMPAATASSLGVAARNVLEVLDAEERGDLRNLDVDGVLRRFTKKRARDFSPGSLKVYGQRTRRAIEDFLRWRNDPANFSVKTRTTAAGKKGKPKAGLDPLPLSINESNQPESQMPRNPAGYQSAFPVRPGQIVTISNIPDDLTRAEAERLAQFIQMLATG
jgi:hypothetical protein